MDPVAVPAVIAGIIAIVRIFATSAKTKRDLRDLEKDREARIARERQAEELVTAGLRRIAELEAQIEFRERLNNSPGGPSNRTDPSTEEESHETADFDTPVPDRRVRRPRT